MKLVPMLAVVIFLIFAGAANAAPNNFNEAVKDYNDGHYAHALSEFDALKASYPNNALVRYYDGLCLQAAGRFEKAKSEFNFVMTCPDQRLRSLAQRGLAQLSNAHSTGHTGVTSVYNSVTSGSYGSSTSSAPGKVKRVLEFYADWCGPCKAFAPVFEEVKAQMHDVQFDRYNVDTAEGKELSGKYQFPTIPHAVFLDGGGNVLFNGSPEREVESFTQQIRRFK
jgi:thioredoxin 1